MAKRDIRPIALLHPLNAQSLTGKGILMIVGLLINII